ncbi:MAG: RtcB family protein [Pirellulaceae bacterium]|nr:RtcB family protein [Pirellulaceae bacterium]
MVSPTHIYPGPVGVDIKCSMSLIQFDVPAAELDDDAARRRLLAAVARRVPTGGSERKGKKHRRRYEKKLAEKIVIEGASADVLDQLGVPIEWRTRCEDASHVGHDGTTAALGDRLDRLRHERRLTKLCERLEQLGSLGGGNHFGECEVVRIGASDAARRVAAAFRLNDDCAAFLSHCGSRGFGFQLATGQFQSLQNKFSDWRIPYPGGDRELVYAPVGSLEANAYLDDMGLAGNFASINHLLINAAVADAFREVFPGASGQLVYFLSHNIVRRETVGERECWVHRKGATRAYPAGHPSLAETPFAECGHPILLPGNPRDGSVVMVAEDGAADNCFSVNHGAGRRLSRKRAKVELRQREIDSELASHDVLTNCRNFPVDDAPAAYKNFTDVVDSVVAANLASEVARLEAKFVLKDGGATRRTP